MAPLSNEVVDDETRKVTGGALDVPVGGVSDVASVKRLIRSAIQVDEEGQVGRGDAQDAAWLEHAETLAQHARPCRIGDVLNDVLAIDQRKGIRIERIARGRIQVCSP